MTESNIQTQTIRFYDALADNESTACEPSEETLKKIAHELTENLRQNITVDWSAGKCPGKIAIIQQMLSRKGIQDDLIDKFNVA